MYKVDELLDKITNFDGLPQQEKVKIMAFFYTVVTENENFNPSNIRDCFLNEKLKLPANISREFNLLSIRKPPIFLKRKGGYLFERHAQKSLEELYLGSSSKKTVSSSLRALTSKISSLQQRDFLEECICCFEIKAYRSAIVMSWLLAIDTIFEYVVKFKLIEFNAAIQAHGKYKKVVIYSKEDFNDLKESDFIELLRVSKIISNDSRKILDEKLQFRNTCAHPNSIIIKDTKAIAFIEDIIENIILKFN